MNKTMKMHEEKIQTQSIKGSKGNVRCDYLRSKILLYIHMARYGKHAVYFRDVSKLLLDFAKQTVEKLCSI